MKNLKYQTYKLKYKNFPLEYDLIKEKNAQPHDYSKDYLTIEALEDGTISFNIKSTLGTDAVTSISYSTDNGNTWNTTNNQDDKSEDLVISVDVTTGDKILWKGIAKGYYNITGSQFGSTCKFNASGNIMSLLYGDDFNGKIRFPENSSSQFRYLFKESGITDASNLILPAITLADSCYSSMFLDCTNLATAPELPATTLASSCYSNMFGNCTLLVTAPKLPATTLAIGCYASMFGGCRSLVTAPELPATTLASSCYSYMFPSCTSLTIAPELPATTLAEYCYSGMFSGCSSLNYIKAMFTTTPSSSYTNNWVSGVSSSGTFVKNSAATWNVTGSNGIPTGWTVETADQ